MRTWQIVRFGPDPLQLADLPLPAPAPGQVLVRVHACSLNARDSMLAAGTYNPRQPLPFVPLSDGAGIVEAVGEGVTRVNPGDRVAAIFSQSWIAGPVARERNRDTLGSPLDGMLREYAVLPAEGVVRIPAHLSFEQAATLPCAAVTAWNALVEQGRVRSGDVVVVEGTGGVSLFALQFARLAGARVIVTSSSDEKLERARALGAWETINYVTHPDWDRRVKRFTSGIGADHIVEVGGAGTLTRSTQAIRPGGTISIIGVLGGSTAEIPLTRVLMQNVRLQGVVVGSRDTFESMNRAIESARLEPPIDRTFDFTAAPAALRYFDSRQHVGKVCIRVST